MRTPPRGLHVLLALFAVSAGACAPGRGYDVDLQAKPVDIVYGEQDRAVPAPVVTPDTHAGFPGFVAPPPGAHRVAADRVPAPTTVAPSPGTPSTTAPAPLVACREPVAGQPPELDVTTDIYGAPAAATYPFRRTGTVTQDGAARPLAPSTSREATSATSTPAMGRTLLEWDIVERDGPVVTTTRYQADGAGITPGLKIVRVTTAGPDGTDVFAPDAPVRIMTLPAAIDQPTTDAGTDAVRGTAMVVTHRTARRGRVPACGATIAAWEVEVSGSIRNPQQGKLLDFTGSLFVATQYGGLIVQDVLEMTGTDNGGTVALSSRSTIDHVPKRVT